MITDIETALRREGVLPEAGSPVNVHLGRSKLLEFFPAGAAPIAVKAVSDDPGAADTLRREYAALSLQVPAYSDLIPRPLALVTDADLTMFAMENVSHKSLGIAQLDGLPSVQANRLVTFLTDSDKSSPPATRNVPTIPEQYLEARAGLPAALVPAISNIETARDWQGKLGRLTPVPQHSDLSINNIGLCENGVIIFDWEDYGNVVLPGFDFLTLVLSGLEFSTDAAEAYFQKHLNGPEQDPPWCRSVADDLGLDADNVFDFIMIVGIVFLYQKQKLGYGTRITEYLENMLTDTAARFSV